MIAQRKAAVRIVQITAVLVTLTIVPCQAAARVFAFRATVPFRFVVGQETLPAAMYTVEILLGQSQEWDPTGVIVLKTPDGRVYRTAFTTVADSHRWRKSAQSGLVFKHLAGKHYLTLVTMASVELDLGVASRVPTDTEPIHSTEVPMEVIR